MRLVWWQDFSKRPNVSLTIFHPFSHGNNEEVANTMTKSSILSLTISMRNPLVRPSFGDSSIWASLSDIHVEKQRGRTYLPIIMACSASNDLRPTSRPHAFRTLIIVLFSPSLTACPTNAANGRPRTKNANNVVLRVLAVCFLNVSHLRQSARAINATCTGTLYVQELHTV